MNPSYYSADKDYLDKLDGLAKKVEIQQADIKVVNPQDIQKWKRFIQNDKINIIRQKTKIHNQRVSLQKERQELKKLKKIFEGNHQKVFQGSQYTSESQQLIKELLAENDRIQQKMRNQTQQFRQEIEAKNQEIKKLQREKNRIEESKIRSQQCIICNSRPIQKINNQCGHFCVCSDQQCLGIIKEKCPICLTTGKYINVHRP